MDEHRGHRAVDAAGQAANHLLETHLLLDAVNGLFPEGSHGPIAAAAADVDDEVLEKTRAVRRVKHFQMELRAIELPLVVGNSGEGRAVGYSDSTESLWQRDDAVAMTHPDL